MKSLYCGLELHSTNSRVLAMKENGSIVSDRTFSTTGHNLAEVFSSLKGQLHIHLEASEMAGWARSLLLEHLPAAKRVVASHPKTNLWIATDPMKRDEIDAPRLAHLIRGDFLHEVYYPEDRDLAAFNKTVQHYEDLTGEQAGLQTKMKSRLRMEGIDLLSAVERGIVRQLGCGSLCRSEARGWPRHAQSSHSGLPAKSAVPPHRRSLWTELWHGRSESLLDCAEAG